jgi:hypothetical protein
MGCHAACAGERLQRRKGVGGSRVALRTKNAPALDLPARELVLVMQRATTGTYALKAKLGVAAKLTVDESGPHLRRWKAMPPREGYGYSEENGSEAARVASGSKNAPALDPTSFVSLRGQSAARAREAFL